MKDIEPRNENRKPHGYWEWYWVNGSRAYKCFFNNGNQVGYLETYCSNNDELDYKKYHI